MILYSAQRKGKILGTIAAFLDHQQAQRQEGLVGGFGFFEVINDFEVCKELLDAACEWLREKSIQMMRGPTNFTDNDNPGVLIEGADCPPVMLEAHTLHYHKDFQEKYGMEKSHDLYAWRAFREQIGEELKNIPPDLLRVAEVARKAAKAKRLIKLIDIVSFKLLGLLEEYRHRGIDAMLYLEAVKAIYEKGYAWLDGSVCSEYNPAVNLITNRLGAERYKQYRIYQMKI